MNMRLVSSNLQNFGELAFVGEDLHSTADDMPNKAAAIFQTNRGLDHQWDLEVLQKAFILTFGDDVCVVPMYDFNNGHNELRYLITFTLYGMVRSSRKLMHAKLQNLRHYYGQTYMARHDDCWVCHGYVHPRWRRILGCPHCKANLVFA